jgi:D-alanyl-D-alanine carboxypeptidase-like protein
MAVNGQLPPDALAPIASGQLEKAAAAAWNAMNVEARANGLQLVPTGSKSSYRTYAQQQELYALYQSGKGNLAAVPGTSNHGWGLAVDLATTQMRSLLDRIGRKYGWAKDWSDAPSEWWHIKYRTGVWSGPDPGPSGTAATPAPPAAPVIPELPKGVEPESMALGTMPDGRFEVFVEDEAGEVWHAWQAKEGGWAGAVKGKRTAAWESLGKPGG